MKLIYSRRNHQHTRITLTNTKQKQSADSACWRYGGGPGAGHSIIVDYIRRAKLQRAETEAERIHQWQPDWKAKKGRLSARGEQKSVIDDECSLFAIGRKHGMKLCQIGSRSGYQGGQAIARGKVNFSRNPSLVA